MAFEWMQELDRADLEDVIGVLKELRRSLTMKLRPLRVSALPVDAPERPPVGNEDYWYNRRRETVNLLDDHGLLVFMGNLVDGFVAVEANKDVIVAAIEAAERVQSPAEAAQVPSEATRAPSGPVAGLARRVFIVHGRDETNLLRLQRLLEKDFHVETIVMKEEAARGRALIEKFEDVASGADFAFVLMSPDDEVQTAAGTYAQARPNVTFELGWFVGRLTRRRVALLVRKGTRMHSDFDGIERIDFVESVEEVVGRIKKELEAVR